MTEPNDRPSGPLPETAEVNDPEPSAAFPDDGSGASPAPVPTVGGVAPTLDNTVSLAVGTDNTITLDNTTLYDAAGKIIGKGGTGTYEATIIARGGIDWYKFRRKGRTVYAKVSAKSLQPGHEHSTGGVNVPPAKIEPKVARFVAGFLALARGASHRCNVSPWVILAQWAVETGWGSSSLAVEHHNLAGIRWYNRPGQRQVGGTPGKIGTGFAAYSSVREFTDDYVYVMNLPYYRAVRILWHPVDDEQGVILPQCRALGASPYDAGHYRARTAENGHALIGAWHLLRPAALAAAAKGPNA